MEMDRLPLLANAGSGIEQSRVSDKAEHYLRSLIFSGQLAPGDKLPPERDLATQLGISIITLRGALKSLEGARFVLVKLGSKGGWFVNDAPAITRCWHDWMRDHRHELDDLLEFRSIVETGVASLAAARRTPEDLETLEQAGCEPQEDWFSVVRWHNNFHDALAAAAHNHYLEWAQQAIRAELFLPVDQVIAEHRVAEIRRVHDEVLAAVQDKDPARAAREMQAHLEFTDKLFGTDPKE
jgi:GntR family transcriptional repressor for pyruvate dehydrogenase complex